MKKKYPQLAIINLLLAVGVIYLFFPYIIETFKLYKYDWTKYVSKILIKDYYKPSYYVATGLLIWIAGLNLLTMLIRINVPKFLFKTNILIALGLPLIYMLAIKNSTIANFWSKTIFPNMSMILTVLLCVCWGNWILGLVYNFTHKKRANLHHIVETLFMCFLLTLMILSDAWTGGIVGGYWSEGYIVFTEKAYCIIMGLFALYLPISSLVLYTCRNNRD